MEPSEDPSGGTVVLTDWQQQCHLNLLEMKILTLPTQSYESESLRALEGETQILF